MQLSRPLLPAQRVAFLEMLATKLNGQRELGDGAIYRLCRELQREHFDPPQFVSVRQPCPLSGKPDIEPTSPNDRV